MKTVKVYSIEKGTHIVHNGETKEVLTNREYENNRTYNVVEFVNGGVHLVSRKIVLRLPTVLELKEYRKNNPKFVCNGRTFNTHDEAVQFVVSMEMNGVSTSPIQKR